MTTKTISNPRFWIDGRYMEITTTGDAGAFGREAAAYIADCLTDADMRAEAVPGGHWHAVRVTAPSGHVGYVRHVPANVPVDYNAPDLTY